jgi:hypothetical protein
MGTDSDGLGLILTYDLLHYGGKPFLSDGGSLTSRQSKIKILPGFTPQIKKAICDTPGYESFTQIMLKNHLYPTLP